MTSGQLVFQPPKFDWHSEDQQQAFEEWKGQITLALTVSNFREEIWFATIVGYLGKEGFKWWNTLPISTDVEARKNPEQVFKAIADTLEVLTSYWNHIDKMYSDIRQGEHESTDQLDQCIKNIVKDVNIVQKQRNWYVEQSYFSMWQSILKLKNGSGQKRREQTSHMSHSFNMPKSMKWQWRTSTDISPMVEPW